MNKNKAANNKYVLAWLTACCACMFIMVILGGLTRLTDSGLSIMKWEPLSGIVPPLHAEEWQGYFEEYKKIPQYELHNKGMTLEEFKGIFWLEYFHRLMARLTGFIVLLPLIYFAARRQIDKATAAKFGGIFILGAIQGVIGWYMVSSGFGARTEVSQYRLALHLGSAFLIFALIYWARLDVKFVTAEKWQWNCKSKYALGVSALVFVMVILGAFMAGTHAGFTYNTFPLMDGRLVPEGLNQLSPWWKNHFENITMIQFQHRMVAYVTAIAVFILASKVEKKLAACLIVTVLVQIALGVGTLHAFGSYADYEPVSHAYKKVLYLPVIIAALHQLNALVLFTFSIRATHYLAKETAPAGLKSLRNL